MLDYSKIEQYQENNRIEAKLSAGGLPESIWETYSAFANTMGGLILLGVREKPDKSFEIGGLSNPLKMVNDFWSLLEDGHKVNIDLLNEDDVQIIHVDGKSIIEIEVPAASRMDRPVYVGESPYGGTYHRTGEGDYRLSNKDVNAMLNDKTLLTPDQDILPAMTMADLDPDTIRLYRMRSLSSKPALSRNQLDDEQFLVSIGALIQDQEKYSLTAGGLLMFGKKESILKVFPDYKACLYKEENGTSLLLNDNVHQNLYRFYYSVLSRFNESGISPVILTALKEALSNTLINADYSLPEPVTVILYDSGVTMINSGLFRTDLKSAETGGISDPRNYIIMKLFRQISSSSSFGTGIPLINLIWNNNYHHRPVWTETFNPPATRLDLVMTVSEHKENGDESINELSVAFARYLTIKIKAGTKELADIFNLSQNKTREVIESMKKAGTIRSEGRGRGTVYRLTYEHESLSGK